MKATDGLLKPRVLEVISNAEKSIEEMTGLACKLFLRYEVDVDPAKKAALLKTVCKAFKVPVSDVLESLTRKRELVDAKHVYWYFCNQHYMLSIRKLSMDFHCDFTTVRSAVEKIEDLLDTTDPIVNTIQKIKSRLK